MGGVARAIGSVFSGVSRIFGGGHDHYQSAPVFAPAPTPAAAPAPQTNSASMESESSDAVKKKKRGKQQLMIQPRSINTTSTGLNL